MNSKHIIFVPGKNPKPQAEQHRELLWRALLEGVHRADASTADAMRPVREQFHLVSWNYLYYQEYKDISRELPWIDALINQHGPTPKDIAEAISWNYRKNRLILKIVDHLPALIRFLPEEARSTEIEIKRYFSNGDNIAQDIRKLLKDQLRSLLKKGDQVLLVGHSLGSVIAYDSLWELTHEEGLDGKVDLLTIGSPLGMHYVRRHLLGLKGTNHKSYPGMIRRWINVASEGDVTALERNLSDSFKAMREQGLVDSIEDHCKGIYNYFRNDEGLNCHRSYGYLVNPAVGIVIANWWKQR